MHQRRPQISAALLLGMILAPVPAKAAEAVLTIAAREISRRRWPAFGHLERESRILVDPIDLPWQFMLRLGRERPELSLVNGEMPPPCDAAIRAPFSALIALLEGRIDGDALFFSRDLMIEGDLERVVELRNAVDGAEISVIEDMSAALGPLAGPASRACRSLLSLAEGAAARMERIAAAIDAPKRAAG